jgi:hypothetical protein
MLMGLSASFNKICSTAAGCLLWFAGGSAMRHTNNDSHFFTGQCCPLIHYLHFQITEIPAICLHDIVHLHHMWHANRSAPACNIAAGSSRCQALPGCSAWSRSGHEQCWFRPGYANAYACAIQESVQHDTQRQDRHGRGQTAAAAGPQ